MANKGRLNRFAHRALIGMVLGMFALPACSSNGGGGTPGAGGSMGSGGASATGGASSASGGANAGGTTGSGGSSSSGGAVGSGGSASSGGMTGAGGTAGTTSSGGKSTGGTVGSGGTSSGGASGVGGSGAGGVTGKGGASASGGATGGATSSGTGGNTGSGGSGSGGLTGAGGKGGTTGTGGGEGGGTGGATDAGADAPSAKSFTCNTVLGIDSTSEWYTGGFENEVVDSKWQLIYNHPGYVEDWESASDAVYSKAPTSPCSANSDNPDRVILNVFTDPSGSLTTSAALVTGLSKAVDTIKSKYSRLKRLDLLTMSRGPNNQQCFNSSNTVVAAYVDDAISKVVTAYPGLVTASPKFYVTDCSDFDSSNPPHLSTAGKTNMAKVYGDYYSTEP